MSKKYQARLNKNKTLFTISGDMVVIKKGTVVRNFKSFKEMVEFKNRIHKIAVKFTTPKSTSPMFCNKHYDIDYFEVTITQKKLYDIKH